MIISASRRTDIPTYYSDWFFNRIKEGSVCVRNPMNIHQVSRIDLSPDVVDGIVFWTKNPIPMIDRLSELKKYVYYFQFTVNSYGKDIEPNVPLKKDIIIPAFKKLSSAVGKERVVWRYDPIFINEKYTVEYHKKYFRILCSELSRYTEKCSVSFIDIYKNTERSMKKFNIRPLTNDEIVEMMSSFVISAKNEGIYIDTCAEEYDLSPLGISHACCVDKQRFERLGNYTLKIGKDKSQRNTCGCIESVDIGAYNTCENGCVYCYANYSRTAAAKNYSEHDPSSPIIFGAIGEDDKVTERKVRSNIESQFTLF